MIKYFSDFRYVDPFRRYSRSKSKVVKNRAEFWTFFALPNFVGGTLCKISVHLITSCHVPRHLVKFREGRPTTPKAIGAHVWNIKPNFKCSSLKFLRGPLTPIARCATKAWSNYSTCKNFRTQHPLGAEIQSVEKS